MKLIRLLALTALGLTIVPAVLFATGHLSDGAMKLTMVVGTLLWFVTAPRWLRGGSE